MGGEGGGVNGGVNGACAATPPPLHQSANGGIRFRSKEVRSSFRGRRLLHGVLCRRCHDVAPDMGHGEPRCCGMAVTAEGT